MLYIDAEKSPAARLLVVAAHDARQDPLSGRLRQHGYEATDVTDGTGALSILQRATFDLVLLDADASGGLDVLRRVRASHSRAKLPVIMVTTRAAGQDVMELLQAGANDYLHAPIDLQVALARIETHLSHKRAVEELRDSEERYALAVRGANDGLWDWNLTTGQVYWSPRWRSILGLEQAAVTADPNEWLHRIHPDDQARVRTLLAQHLAHGTGHFETEHRVRHRDDSYRWVLCRGAAVRNEGGVATRFAGSLTDVTSTKLADALTGLPNRFLFLDVVERAMRRAMRQAKRGGDYGFAIVVLTIDRLRMVHDSLGAAAADRMLVAVAQRLQAGLRATDVVTREERGITLARHGGDEFNVLVDDITDVAGAVTVADRLRRALDAPFEIDGHQIFASARMGIAVSGSGYTSGEEILRDATTALNRATASPSVPYEIFDPEMRRRATTRLKVETDLRHAIGHRGFEVHYQPIVALTNGRIAGFEALVRWRHPANGLLLPGEFIGVAEDTGMIIDIDRLTLAVSCRQMAAWLDNFGVDAPRVMCANVSGRQFGDAAMMDYVTATLETAGLNPAHLKLEITENALIGDLPGAQRLLDRVRALGVAWSLDDFGTGYSSLSALHQLGVNTLKVDRSFVSALGAGGRTGSAMVRAIISLAHALSMDVVAEGVETADQAAELRALGCEYAQGFYFSPAVDTATATRLIASQPWQGTRHSVAS